MRETVFREQGQPANDVLLLRTGVARISQAHQHVSRTVGYLTAGQVFGLDEVTRCERDFRSSLHAIGHVSVVGIPRYLVENLLNVPPFRLTPRVPRPAAPSGQTLTIPDPRLSNTTDAADIDPGFVDFLVQHRYTAGTSTMVIDMNRCTRCDDCVRACSAAHDNNPRFIRHGPIYANHMLPTACLHCDDPLCLIDCPTGAIHRDQIGGEVVINEQTCIGCAACANNCPHNAIRMVNIRDDHGDFLFDDRGVPLKQATKCDLCSGQFGGPACERACPHDALRRIDLRSVSPVGG